MERERGRDFFDTIQGDSGGMVNILGHCEKKFLYEQVSNSES